MFFFAGDKDPEKDAEFDALLSAEKSAVKTPKRARKASVSSEDNASMSAKKPKARSSMAKKAAIIDEDLNQSDAPAETLNHTSTK